MIQAILQYIVHGIVAIAMVVVILAFLGQIIYDGRALYRAACAERRHKQNNSYLCKTNSKQS